MRDVSSKEYSSRSTQARAVLRVLFYSLNGKNITK